MNFKDFYVPTNVFVDPTLPFQNNHKVTLLAYENLCQDKISTKQFSETSDVYKDAEKVKELIENLYIKAFYYFCSDSCKCKDNQNIFMPS